MSKSFLVIIIFFALLALGLGAGFAFADSPDNPVVIMPERVLPEQYCEFGNLSRIVVANDETLAVIESMGEEKYLRIVGETPRKRILNEPYSNVTKISIYGNYVLGNFGGDFISTYSIAEDAFNVTGVSSQAMYDIAVSEDENRLYILKNDGLIWYELVAGIALNIAYQGHFDFPHDENFVNPNRIAIQDEVVYMYNTNANKVYSYTVNEGINQVFSGLMSNASVETLFYPCSEGFFLVKSDGIYLNGYDNKVISVSDTADDASPLAISGIAVQNDKIYIIDNAYNAIKLFNLSDYSFESYYGSYGKGMLRLDSPTGLIYGDNGIFVADTGNNRILSYTEQGGVITADGFYGSVPASPKLLAATSEGVYAGKGDNHIFYYEENTYANTYSFDENVTSVSVLSDDVVYAASGNKIFRKMPSETAFSEYISADDAVSFVAGGLYGRILYALIKDTIYCYYSDDIRYTATILLTDYDFEAADIVSILADYNGNLFLIAENTIMRFDRNASGYNLGEEFEVSNIDTISGAAMSSDGTLYFTSRHSLYELTGLGVVTEEESLFEDPQNIEYPVRIVYGGGFLQKAPNNYEDVLYIGEDEYLMVFTSDVTYEQVEYYFVEYDNRRMYISQNNCELIEAELLQDTYVTCLFDTVNIYRYPSSTSPKIFEGLTRNHVIEVKGFVAGTAGSELWGWYRVAYEGSEGYVQISSVVTAERPFEPVVRYYVKAKSAHFGASIKVYAEASENSEVIATITDGSRVELTVPYNEESGFSEIRINNGFGYVLTDNLMEKGLTNGQILAIVLSVVTIAASIVTILLFKLFNRKR